METKLLLSNIETDGICLSLLCGWIGKHNSGKENFNLLKMKANLEIIAEQDAELQLTVNWGEVWENEPYQLLIYECGELVAVVEELEVLRLKEN